MAKDKGLEELRALFKDQRQYSAIGLIKKLGALSDRSALRVRVSLFPDEREIIATMTWDAVGPDAGDFDFPAIDDLVLVILVDGDPDQAYVVKRLTSKIDTIPAKALDGHMVRQARAGKKAILASDTRIALATPGGEGDEPLVLGNVMKDCLTELFTQLGTLLTSLDTKPIVICSAPGSPGLIHPTLKVDVDMVKSALEDAKDMFVTDDSTNIVSQLAYTERGGA